VEVEPGFVDFFRQLQAAGYDGRVSVEGFSQDFYAEAGRALKVLKSLGS
jgi:sugar phosphate isomerase/epimerase